jgi:hypothetical protein
VVVVNGDLLDQLSNEAFVEFGDFGLLTSDKVLQLGDALLGFLAAAGVCLGLRFLLAQRKDFIGDGIVVLLAVGLSDELFLQLVEPGLDTRPGSSCRHPLSLLRCFPASAGGNHPCR